MKSEEIKDLFAQFEIHPDDGKRHRHRSFAMSEAEIIPLMICFHYGSFRNLKHFYLFYVVKHLQSEFPQSTDNSSCTMQNFKGEDKLIRCVYVKKRKGAIR
ncbi:MAG: hypothetical protein LBD89_00240 [Tannerellaceae bacterium]|jgi:hypothetical protein|nr:hypothetical protein [Tannerellaceae bacterium]